MIQLKVYDSQDKSLDQYWLDLYETQPIKLNLSVEDITNAEAKSVFSRTFKVPATPANNIFFKHAFLIDGVDYDVTVKKPAEILVDGAEFRQGHIRLQRIYVNGAQDKIDYEILFLGETRDFSSAVGDATMCTLTMEDLAHDLTGNNVVESWQAYPEGSLTDGLKDGDLIYPLIDFGIDGDHSSSNPRIAVDGSHNFTSNELPLNRLKPMIRARKCFGQIFDNAGYTFTSSFLDSAFFKQIYLSAFGNIATAVLDEDENSTNTMIATDNIDQAANDALIIQQVVNDPSYDNLQTTDGKNYQYSTSSSYYVNQQTGPYIMTAQAYYSGQSQQSEGDPPQNESGRLILQKSQNAGSTWSDVAIGAWGSSGSTISVQGSFSLDVTAPADRIRVISETTNPSLIRNSVIRAKEFQVISAPGTALPNSALDCEYKQIDFIKDILTTFRLVMSPDPGDSRNFIIEPFINYVASGDLYDWSDKLIRDKDFVIEPLFNTQSDQIEYKHKDDGDYINLYHNQAYKHVFGYLRFDSGNELLKGTRKIETNWAPTPLTQIEGATATESFIIPQLHTHNSEDGATVHRPIKPKSRLLFYNGLQDTDGYNWKLADTTQNHFTDYPLVSYYNEWPMDQDTQVLNWNVDIPYWGEQVTGLDGLSTQFDLYTTYWSGYIQSLYNSTARRVTAYFTLNNVDLQTFSFDDVIFVDGTYYRPEKINDAQIGITGPVKVQLIKLIDYIPAQVVDAGLTFTVTEAGPSCFNGSDGQATFVFSTPVTFPVSWSSTSGDSGTFNINPGLIDNQTPGTYTITMTDNAGRTDTTQITVPQSTASALTAIAAVTDPSDCYTSDGAVTISGVGGTAPYTIAWTDSTSTSFTRTGLASANYTFTLTDSLGCQTAATTVLVSCQVVIPQQDISSITEWVTGGVCQGESQADTTDLVVIHVDSGESPALATDGFYVYDGDWASLQSQYGTSSGTLVPMDQDNTCGATEWYYDATSIYDALDRPFLYCYCLASSPFYTQTQTISTNPYIFVAQT